jgi:acetyl esterase/lipase
MEDKHWEKPDMRRSSLLAVLISLAIGASAFATTRTWTGAVNGNWSNGGNWTPAGAPAANQPMLFPAGASNLLMNNDLAPGTVLGPIEFDANYTVGGNTLNFGANVIGGFTCNADVKLVAPLLLGGATYNGTVDINGQHVTINQSNTFNGQIIGTGIIDTAGVLNWLGLEVYGGGSFSGTINGRVSLHGGASLSSATLFGELRGIGTMGNTTIGPAGGAIAGYLLPGDFISYGRGVLHTKNLSVGGAYYVEIDPAASDSVQVSGSVALASNLAIVTVVSTPSAGQTFAIIDNDGTDPVSGTFNGLPEGSVISAGGVLFRISYVGNDGNDVVLTRVLPSSITIGQSAATTKFGQSFSLTATVSGPTLGNVNFYDNGAPIGSGSIVSGVATLSISTLALGTHGNLTATFNGSSNYAASTSAPLSHEVTKETATIEARSLRSPSAAGEDVLVRVSVNTTAPIAGTITVSENGTQLEQQAISSATATIAVHHLASGLHTLVVTFSGPSFEPASDSFTQAISSPALSVLGTAVAEGNSGTKAVTLSVHLSAPSLAPVMVAYATADGTAKAGEDYLAANGTLTFAPGETAKPIGVTILGDTTLESDEQFQVVLSGPAGAVLDDGPATVTILNDDASFHASAFEYANASGTSLMLDVYTPVTGAGPFPVVLWIPGTVAYAPSGDSAAVRQTMRGYVVIVASYRAAGAAPFPAQLDDLKTAVRWIRANAVRLNIDPQHIGVWGSGAGAHLAALLGTTGDTVSAGSLAEGNPAFSNRVQSVIDWGGAADLLHLQADAPASCAATFNAPSSPQSQLIGCPLQACAAAATAASPQSFVSSDDAPILIMHGAADCVVPVEQSRRFYTALKSAGVDATLNVIDGVGSFDTYWLSSAAHAAVDAFLDAHLKTGSSRRRGAGH